MATNSKSTVNGLRKLNADDLKGIDFFSDNLMKKLVQREIARTSRTSEILYIAVICFEKLLINSTSQIGSEKQIKQFFKSVVKLRKNVRVTDLFGWIVKDTTFGIVFTAPKNISKEIIESRINEILEISVYNATFVNIDVDVLVWSAEYENTNEDKFETVIENYFKKKNLFMNQG